MNLRKHFFNIKYSLFFRNKLWFNHQMKSNLELSKDEIVRLNWEKRKSLVNYAYNNVPFYNAWYKAHGFDPVNLQSEKDWCSIPILTKELIRENFQLMKTKNLSDKYFLKSTTGGSTGNPLKVLFDRRVPLEMIGWRVMRWWGVNPFDNQAYAFRKVHVGHRMILNNLLWWPTKRIFLDASSISGNDIKLFLLKFNRIKPRFLQGYVGAIFELARYIEKHDIEITAPLAVWVTSAPLIESQRIFMQKIFKAPVYDQYGCGEIFWLAAECKVKQGLHFMYDLRHIEFVDQNDCDVLGNVVLTDLENLAFPIIRYMNGDKGRFLNRECTCGCPLPLIDKIKGRTTDFIITQNDIYILMVHI